MSILPLQGFLFCSWQYCGARVKMEQRKIREKIEEGWLHTRIVLEILGKPKEHVEKTLRDYVKKIKETEKAFMVTNEFFSEPKEQGEAGELFSIFAELEMLVKNPESLAWFCFDYMPSSVEIIEPEVLQYKVRDFSSLINDLLARLHDVDMQYKNLSIENDLIHKSNTIMLRRVVLSSLKVKELTLEELSGETGIGVKQLFAFLGSMINDKLIKKEGEKYTLADE